MRRSLGLMLVMLALVAGLASAATLNVPSASYPTITAALAAANPGDTITVGANYTGAEEKFPILVQKNNITIRAQGDVTIGGTDSHAVFVVGAFRVFNEQTLEYEYKTVSGVTIEGFRIIGRADIGIVVKEATNATIKNNTIEPGVVDGEPQTILEGIRLVGASNSTISNNRIARMGGHDGTQYLMDGIGINVEESAYNELRNNTVTECGLGLFMHESSRNGVSGDTYTDNLFGGVVLNDTAQNVLDDLTVTDNGGWGVRFVHAYDDTLQNSVVTYNLAGGVQLIASEQSTVDGNLVASNGDSDDLTANTVQIVVAPGDKALFTSPVIDALNTLEVDGEPITKPMNDFVLEKHQIEQKLDLLEWWLHDLNDELENIKQRVLMGNTEQALRELYAIHQTDSNVITRGDVDENQIDIRWHGMGDPRYNFTYWDYDEHGDYDPASTNQHPFDEHWDLLSVAKLDFYSGIWVEQTPSGWTDDEVNLISFGLERATTTGDPHYNRIEQDDDELSMTKLELIRTLITAIGNELSNEWTDQAWDHERGFIDDPTDVEALDSLWEKLDHWMELGLITVSQDFYDNRDKDDRDDFLHEGNEYTYDDLVRKLLAVIAWNEILSDQLGEIEGALDGLDVSDIGEVMDAIDTVEEAKAKMFKAIADMRHKLALIDLELPPLPRINSDLVGKKEKPVLEIDDPVEGETEDVIGGIKTGARAGAIPSSIWNALSSIYNDLGVDAVSVDQLGRTHSTGNVISSNIVTSDLMRDSQGDDQGINIGIIIASPHNVVVNNLVTNEGIPELDEYLRHIKVGDDPIYGRMYRLDVGLWLLANETLIAYNAFEFVDWAIKRGGKVCWPDYQLEYIFTKLAHVAYWPGPGQVLELDRYDETLEPGDKYYPPTVYVDYLPVLRLQDGPLTTITTTDTSTNEKVEVWEACVSAEVVGNRLSLNFFDHTGTGIQIIKAHSNIIDENLFYRVATGNIIFESGAGPGIIIRHNDHFGGTAVANEMGNRQVDASSDYTPPTPPGFADVSGDVKPPAAPAPWAHGNFLTLDKFKTLEGWVASKMGIEVELQKYQWEGLPPNLDFFGLSITLPTDKPRHPDDIGFDVEDPGTVQRCTTFDRGWNLVSPPVQPVNTAPGAVFNEVNPLFLYQYNPATGNWDKTETGTLTEVHVLGGYWLYVLEDDTQVCVTGTPRTGVVEHQLGNKGWQMIGVPFDVAWGPAAGGSIRVRHDGQTKTLVEAVNAGWLFHTIWDWNTATASWNKPTVATGTTLSAWNGYWIWTALDNLVLIFDQTPGLPPVPTSVQLTTTMADPGDPPVPQTPITFSADQIVVAGYPNPVTGGQQVTFAVQGPMAIFAEAVRVQVLDVSGRTVFAGEGAGAQVSWGLLDRSGRTVANGVYLFVVEVKAQGEWVRTPVGRILILR